MSQVRRHDNVQLGPEDLLLSIVGGPGEEAVSIFKMVIASGWRPWRARLMRWQLIAAVALKRAREER
jgi:hypothetical protein